MDWRRSREYQLAGCDSGPQRWCHSWWGGGMEGGRKKSGDIQELHVRRWNRWFLTDWVKVLRAREISRVTLGFWLGPWARQ